MLSNKINKYLLPFLGITLFLTSCSDDPIRHKAMTHAEKIQIDRFLDSLTKNLDRYWSADELLFQPSDLVKYSDNYLTRGVINFADGILRFETVNPNYYKALKEEIIMTVLMSNAPSDGQLYHNHFNPSSYQGKNQPFLINQLLDEDRQPITTYAEAENFADFLLTTAVKIRKMANDRFLYYVEWKLITNHLRARALQYKDLIYKYAGRYQVNPRLMFAIMEIESAFNPFARSYAGAIGLMQIVPSTAGVDIFKYLGKGGKPSEKYLYDPEHNIEGAAVYFNIMQTRYFQDIKNPLSLRYMLTASYNAGPGGTLTVFHRDRSRAIEIINSMTPQQVYNKIYYRHYSEQARNYLYKVSKAYKHY